MTAAVMDWPREPLADRASVFLAREWGGSWSLGYETQDGRRFPLGTLLEERAAQVAASAIALYLGLPLDIGGVA